MSGQMFIFICLPSYRLSHYFCIPDHYLNSEVTFIVSGSGYFCTLGIGFVAAWLLSGRGVGSGSFRGAEVRRLFFVQGIFISWGV
jgi:hypothetical protein